MKYYGGCDVGSTHTKAVILDETGKICADTTIRSKINSETSAKLAMEEVLEQVGLKSSQDLAYLIGTGYGRNKVPFADENISEISCHAMGVHVTDPSVKAIIDIGGQDVKGISIDTDGTVKNFAMNDKCAAGTGRFYEAMARSFEMSLPEFSNLSLTAEERHPHHRPVHGFRRVRGHHPGGRRASPWTRSPPASRWPWPSAASSWPRRPAPPTPSPHRRLRQERRSEAGHRAGAEAEGHRPEDRPPADGRSGRRRVRPPEGHGPLRELGLICRRRQRKGDNYV